MPLADSHQNCPIVWAAPWGASWGGRGHLALGFFDSLVNAQLHFFLRAMLEDGDSGKMEGDSSRSLLPGGTQAVQKGKIERVGQTRMETQHGWKLSNKGSREDTVFPELAGDGGILNWLQADLITEKQLRHRDTPAS